LVGTSSASDLGLPPREAVLLRRAQLDSRAQTIDQKIFKLDEDLKKMRDQMARMPEGAAKVRRRSCGRLISAAPWLTVALALCVCACRSPERHEAAGAAAAQAEEAVRRATADRLPSSPVG